MTIWFMSALLALTSIVLTCTSPARADGLVPAGTTAQGLCYATGNNGPRVPCTLIGSTWTRILGAADEATLLRVKPTGASATRLLVDIAADVPGLESFIPAGTTVAQYLANPTSTLQNAATSTCNKPVPGGSVRLPASTLVLPATSSISWACPIAWIGSPPSEQKEFGGTWLRITGTAASPFTLTSPNARGSTFSGFGISQDHPAPGSGWAPTVYPPVFDISGVQGGIKFRDIHLAPVYDFIKADNSGRLEMENIFGQVFKSAYWIDRAYDKSWLSGKQHFWPAWSADSNVMSWQIANTDYVTLGRVDGLEGSLFGYAGRSGLRLIQSPTDNAGGTTGFANKIHFKTLYADSVQYPVWVQKAYSGLPYQLPQVRIDELSAQPTSPLSGASISGSSCLRVENIGGIDLSIGRASCERSGSYAFYLGNTAVAVRLRLGEVYTTYTTGPTIYAASGTVGNNVSIATTPSTDGQPLTNKVAMSVNSPLGPGGLVGMTNGGSLAMSDMQRGYFFVNSVSSYTITMPTNPHDGMEVYQSFLSPVTNLTIQAAAGQNTIYNAPSTASNGSAFTWVWLAGSNAWYRR